MDRQNYTTWRGKMPLSHKERGDGFELFVKAHGWRRVLCDAVPYFSGDRVRLQIGVNKPLRIPMKFKYKLTRWNMNMDCGNANILGEDKQEWIENNIQSGTQDLFDRQLFINGKYTLHMKYEHNGEWSPEIVFFEFNLRDRDITLEKVYIGLVGAGIALIIEAIIRSLN